MPPSPQRYFPRPPLLLLAIFIAILSPLPYAGSWNDGSRLASVEALADHGTWIIDHSIFVKTPGIEPPDTPSPFNENLPGLVARGAMDKMYINGHYYSDKSPVPSLMMATVYKTLQLVTGLKAAVNPALFCYLITLLFSGSAYIISVCCMDAMAATLALPSRARLLLPYGFALTTVALPYTRHINNHILLLAVFTAAMLLSWKLIDPGGRTPWRLLVLGSLAGIGYTIDLGVGPVFVLSIAGFVAVQTRSIKALSIVLGAAFPWFLLHHILNYMIGGTFKPADAVTAYFQWPGTPFTTESLTGRWAHSSVWDFLVYAFAMLFGDRGFIGHSPALYMCLLAIPMLLQSKDRETVFIRFALCLIGGTWLIYAAASNNYSGLCCSIRWFVPLLAPFYWLIALFLKRRPDFTIDVMILSAWGVLLAMMMWIEGPWMEHLVPGYWYIEAGALISWLGWRVCGRRNANVIRPPTESD